MTASLGDFLFFIGGPLEIMLGLLFGVVTPRARWLPLAALVAALSEIAFFAILLPTGLGDIGIGAVVSLWLALMIWTVVGHFVVRRGFLLLRRL